MDETRNNKTRIINMIFSVLLFGGLWGIVEATLGSILHLPIIHHTIFLSSTTILVPIAYFFMGACYKRTGTFRSVFYMGLLAASIKAISCAIFMMSFNPVFYMLLEATAMGIALLVIRPKNVLSFSGLGTLILANTMYLASSTFLRINVFTMSGAEVMDNVIYYVFTLNCVAILYAFIFGSALFGVMKLVEHHSFDFSKVKKIIYHPACASLVVMIAVVVTIVLR